MPTGFTGKIIDGQTFEDFALGCARAFEHCNHQREEPADAKPYPPHSVSNYPKRIAEAEKEIEKLLAMSPKEKEAYGAHCKKERTEEFQVFFNKAILLRNQYNEMRDKVLAWRPPTPNHVIMQTFMVQQLDMSIEHDCDTTFALKKLTELDNTKPIQFYNEALANLKNNVAIYQELLEKEQAANMISRQWILDLYNSLGIDYQ
jgi:hypothetical protein